MSRRNIRLVTPCAAAIVSFGVTNTAGAVDLRDWGRQLAASERFAVLATFDNEAVLDKETQLVWQRTPSAAKGDWYQAFTSCLSQGIGGRRGWRLPRFEELVSLQAKNASGAYVLPAGHPFLNLQSPQLLWTATTFPNPQYIITAAAVYLIGSGSYYYSKTTELSYLCVRGGDGSDGR